MAVLMFLFLLPVSAATPPGMGSLHSFTYDGGVGPNTDHLAPMMDAPAHAMDSLGHVMNAPGQHLDAAAHAGHGGWTSMAGPNEELRSASPRGGASPMGGTPPMMAGDGLPPMGGPPPVGGSSQLHIMQKLAGSPKLGAVSPVQKESPVGVAADYTYFAGKLATDTHNSPDPLDRYSVPISDVGHMLLEGRGPAAQPAKDLHYHDVAPSQTPSSLRQSAKAGAVTYDRASSNPAKSRMNMQIGQPSNLKPIPPVQQQEHKPPPPPAQPPPHLVGPPSAEQLLMSSLFVMGLDKAADQKQVVPEPSVTASKSRGLGPIPGLTAPMHDTPKPLSNTAGMALRAPCDLLVDAVFALDDMKNLWLARESIRYYETQLLPSRKTRFGVVLCGQRKSFYTALHGHFSALLASLEDLQHANATLDPAEHMPDTPGYRSDNNPYPPRVSEDFAQIDMGCLETAYHLLSYQSPGQVDRLLTIVGTKERWANRMAVEEARFLHSLNFSLLALADGSLSRRAQDSLRMMASSPDKYRYINDNVTLHALPAMIGSAICRPQKADVTVAVRRTSTGSAQQPVITNCRLINPTTMQKTMDFGMFGYHHDQVRCTGGRIPNTNICACV